MKVRYTPRARQDLAAIHAFIVDRNPAAAQTVVRSIRDAVRQIADQPYASIRTNDADVRLKLVRRYRYKIFYSVSDGVLVLHIRHPSRGPDWR